MIYNPHLMEKISNTEIKLSRKQYLKVGSDYDILTHLYEMKLGHELRVSGQDFILKFFDETIFKAVAAPTTPKPCTTIFI